MKFRWKFAYNAILHDKIKPRLECYRWKNIKIHSNHCKEYRSIYFQELIGKITNEQKQRAEVESCIVSLIYMLKNFRN
jgi:hypothetical protein